MNDWDIRKTADGRREWTVNDLAVPRNREIELEVEDDDGFTHYTWLNRDDLLEMLEALGEK